MCPMVHYNLMMNKNPTISQRAGCQLQWALLELVDVCFYNTERQNEEMAQNSNSLGMQ